jgi:hypothetical protein
MLAHSRVRTR